MNETGKKIISLIFTLLLGTVLFTGIILTHSLLSPRITANQKKNLEDKLKQLYSDLTTSSDPEFKEDENGFYILQNGETTYLYAEPTEGQGLWGPVEYLVLISNETSIPEIRKIVILSEEETPGLGSRIKEEAFLNQFSGNDINTYFILSGMTDKSIDSDNTDNLSISEIDGITGATGSSVRFIDSLNSYLADKRSKF